MKRILQLAVLAVVTTSFSVEAQTYQTGSADLTIAGTSNQRELDGFIWYPTQETDGAEEIHSNAVWQGVEAIRGAAPAAGSFPLVVLSHGMNGNAMNQSWLASDLAQRGYIVAAISHPGTSTWKRDPEDARQMWLRSQDVSRVIDHFLATPALRAQIDPTRIFMAGHSLGGFTAMELAGGRYDAAKFDGFCGQHAEDLACGVFDGWKVAKTPEDRAAMQADLSDPRIKGFAVFDLGGTQAFSTSSLADIDVPLLVFGAPRDFHGMNLDVESRALVAGLPADLVTYLEPETLAHFDFLGECTPAGLEILKAEEPEDAFVCLEGVAERRADHQMISQEVDRFFSGL